MKLYQLLQSFDFEELFPTVSTMFPNANLHRDVFQKAFDMLCSIQPVMSKKTIRYELMEDPNSSNSMIVGADDEELAANCLLNVLFIGKHPQCFEKDFKKLLK